MAQEAAMQDLVELLVFNRPRTIRVEAVEYGSHSLHRCSEAELTHGLEEFRPIDHATLVIIELAEQLFTVSQCAVNSEHDGRMEAKLEQVVTQDAVKREPGKERLSRPLSAPSWP